MGIRRVFMKRILIRSLVLIIVCLFFQPNFIINAQSSVGADGVAIEDKAVEQNSLTAIETAPEPGHAPVEVSYIFVPSTQKTSGKWEPASFSMPNEVVISVGRRLIIKKNTDSQPSILLSYSDYEPNLKFIGYINKQAVSTGVPGHNESIAYRHDAAVFEAVKPGIVNMTVAIYKGAVAPLKIKVVIVSDNQGSSMLATKPDADGIANSDQSFQQNNQIDVDYMFASIGANGFVAVVPVTPDGPTPTYRIKTSDPDYLAIDETVKANMLTLVKLDLL